MTRLREAFAAKPVDGDALKSAVCVYVDEMKKIGAPVERVIVDIKRIAEAELGPARSVGRGSPQLPSEESVAALSRAVTWCIEHYYWTDGPPKSVK